MVEANKLHTLTTDHTRWRMTECLNLIPSENVTSEDVRGLLASDLGHRYTLMVNDKIHGVFIKNAYGGTKFTDQIELESENLTKEVFNAKYCTLKPLSGHIAGLIMLIALCHRKERIMVIDAKHGGYDGYLPEYMPKFLNLKVKFLPFIENEWNLDFDTVYESIHEFKPQLVIIGASFILFPYNIRPIRDACEDINSYLGYDASHVLGLIGGGEFQKPLDDGVDIVSGSTHKTLFGPQGGLILTNNKEIFDRVSNKLAWHTLDNPHQNRIAALGQTMLEMKGFGSEYAKNVISNSKCLAGALDSFGIPVKFGHKNYTQSHQVLLDIEKIESKYELNNKELMKSLEDQNIIIDAIGRLGTNEMTRRGCDENDMVKIAEFMKRVIVENDQTVKNEILEFLKHCSLRYCFTNR